jgi:quercetin dioxygenase-like cupin family protein
LTRLTEDLPSFVREAFEADRASSAELADALASLAAPTSPPAPDPRRILAEVENLPLRYAPFFAALSTLWDLPEPEVVHTLSRAADPTAWKRAALPGVHSFAVKAGPRLTGANVSLTRFRRGLRFPRHVHAGPEALFVLEGRYEDESGRSVGPGELHEMAAGTEHSVTVDPGEPCTVAVVEFGIQFTGPLLRLLQRLFA